MENENIRKEISQIIQNKIKSSTKKRINSYRKGSDFERKIAKILTEKLGFEIIRVPMSGAFASSYNTDFVAGDLTPTSKDIFFPFVFELKHHNKNNVVLDILNPQKSNKDLIEWCKQAEAEAKRLNKIPIVVFRLNRSPIFVVMKVEDVAKFNNTLFLINPFQKILFYIDNKLYFVSEIDNFDIKNFYEILNKNKKETI